MNEILQQRIESVQAGKNITHAQIEAKRSLREQLERDVENFLAGGGETQVLPIGFTHFKDGVIPQSKAQVISDKERLDREKAIEAKSEEIRKYKAAVKEQKKQQYEAQIQDQIAVMSKFESNLQNKSDFKRLAAMVGCHPQYLKGAAKGRTKLNAAKWDQIKKLVATFEYSEKRIAKAIKEPTKNPKRKAPTAPSAESLRMKRLAEAKSEAIKNGEKSFIAECKKCGPAKFILQAGSKVFCHPCHLAHVERLKQKRMTKEQVSTLEQKRKRFTYNSELAEQTKLQGLRYFNGLCEKCGLTEFRIVGGGRKYHCVHCSKASAQKYKKMEARKYRGDSMNLIEKLGLEKCKQIVENHATCYMPRIFKYWSESLNDYVLAEKYATASVEVIRTALADHDRIDTCSDIQNHISPNTKVIEHE